VTYDELLGSSTEHYFIYSIIIKISAVVVLFFSLSLQKLKNVLRHPSLNQVQIYSRCVVGWFVTAPHISFNLKGTRKVFTALSIFTGLGMFVDQVFI